MNTRKKRPLFHRSGLSGKSALKAKVSRVTITLKKKINKKPTQTDLSL
jgi:hypothetical protein